MLNADGLLFSSVMRLQSEVSLLCFQTQLSPGDMHDGAETCSDDVRRQITRLDRYTRKHRAPIVTAAGPVWFTLLPCQALLLSHDKT